MSQAAAQAYLHTRVSVMSTRLFGPGELAQLTGLGLAELAERYGLSALLDEQVTARAKNRAVEQALISILLSELTVLVRPMTATERALLMAWGRKFALFNLKTLIRGKLYDLDQKEIRENLYDLPPNVRLSHQELFRAENVLELLRQLEQGPHALIARQAREAYEQRREPFALEAAIDQRYYAGLARQVMQFHDANLQPLQHLVGTLLDREDIQCLLRFRFAYRLSPSETFYQLVPSSRMMHRDRLLELVNLETFERVLDALPPPLNALLAGAGNLIDVQRRLHTYMAAEAQRVLGHSPSGVARALAYLILRESQLRSLFALTQGHLLELPVHLVEIAVGLTDPVCPIGSMMAKAA
jgi:V/A-type H+/Na+-transporting ATPase subunit C